MVKNFPDDEKPKYDIHCVTVPIKGRIHWMEKIERYEKREIAYDQPDDIGEQERVRAPQNLTQEK